MPEISATHALQMQWSREGAHLFITDPEQPLRTTNYRVNLQAGTRVLKWKNQPGK